MSDATWDMEYQMAGELYHEIQEYCSDRGIDMPEISEFARSWELRLILEELKKG